MTEEDGKTEDRKEEQATVPKKDLDALRSKLEKRLADANKTASEAQSQVAQLSARITPSEYDIQLPASSDDGEGLDEATVARIKQALNQGKADKQNLNTALQIALQKSAEALSYEVALDVDAVDEREDILTELKKAKTPREMELKAKELKLEYKESKASGKDKDEAGEDSGNSARKFASGGGRAGANKSLEIQNKIDEIDPTDPEAEKKLKALMKEIPGIGV